MEFLTEAVGFASGVAGLVVGAATMWRRITRARKEVMDVIRLAEAFVQKYGEVDDDAKRMRQEIQEAIVAVRRVFSI